MDICNVGTDQGYRFHKDFQFFSLGCWIHNKQPEEGRNNPKNETKHSLVSSRFCRTNKAYQKQIFIRFKTDRITSRIQNNR